VNKQLVELLSRLAFEPMIFSKDSVQFSVLERLAVRLLGLPRVLARRFNREAAASTAVVICNGEFAHGVRHPRAIVLFHGSYFGYARAMAPVLPRRAVRGLMRLSDQQVRGARGKRVVAVSRWLADVLRDQGIRVDAVIENAVDTQLFRPGDAEPRVDRCLFVGSPDHFGKGYDTLEELAAQGVRIDCVSSSRPRSNLLGWLGPATQEQLPALYSRYRALLFPSRFEGAGLVALEAMACGTPVIMTSVGIGPDLAREFPEFVSNASREDLAADMQARLQVVARERERLSAQARAYVLRHHSRERWERQWGGLLADMAGRPGRGA
jgi:glycosyltransferase involved in cell wall biosynthesis